MTDRTTCSVCDDVLGIGLVLGEGDPPFCGMCGEAYKRGAAAERERIWNGVRALIWMVERHPTKDVIYDAHIRRLARDLKVDLNREGAYDERPESVTP